MAGESYPFGFMQGQSQFWEEIEYINCDHPDEEAIEASRNRDRLTRLGLNSYSTAHDVRQRAYQLKEQFQNIIKNGGNGGFENLAGDLDWALTITGDVVNQMETYAFLLTDNTFESLALHRKYRQSTNND